MTLNQTLNTINNGQNARIAGTNTVVYFSGNVRDFNPETQMVICYEQDTRIRRVVKMWDLEMLNGASALAELISWVPAGSPTIELGF